MKYSFPFLIAVGLLNFGCTKESKLNLTFQNDPLKKAFLNNKVASYISYEMDSGGIRKIDTVVLDAMGNIIKIKNIGCCYHEFEMKYDSIGRIISQSQRSDITNFITYQYDYPAENVEIQLEFLADREDDSSRLVYQTIIEFDTETHRPISKKEIFNYFKDTVVYSFEYLGDKLIMEKQLPGSDSTYTQYEYRGNLLLKKKWMRFSNHSYMLEEEFFSPKTGLRDSAYSFDGEFLFKNYYKYYFREK